MTASLRPDAPSRPDESSRPDDSSLTDAPCLTDDRASLRGLRAPRRVRPHLQTFVSACGLLLVTAIAPTSFADERTPSSAEGRPVDGDAAAHSADALLRSIRVRDGYAVELAAAEPLVNDPVAIRFDRFGRLWVVEMPDYPTGPRDGAGPAGRIRVLRDLDGDGVFETATTFADGLMFATGVQPYRDGAIVTLAGSIVFFADRSGDGVADHREVWFEGFATQNEQLRANHPTLGPDGLVYVANGLRGGSVRAVHERFEQRDEPLDLRARDFCFDPEGGAWMAVAGNSQFGLSIDDFGRRIGCSNRNPAMFTPLGLDDVERDPLLTPADAITDVGLSGERSHVMPIADAWTTSNLHAGQFTAACGVIAPGLAVANQGGDEPTAGGDEWLFVCEPTGSLVQRQILSRDGGVWRSRRDPHESEFLASEDSWFRPVDLTIGPGGDLYVVDMARAVIEHPDWVPEELKERGDTWDGVGLGRILRVRPVGRNGSEPVPTTETSATRSRVSRVETAQEALAALRSPTPLEREWGSQYFLEQAVLEPGIDRRGPDRRGSGHDGETESLRTLSHDASAPPASRARAAWLLHRFGRVGAGDLRRLRQAPSPRLRELAIRLAPRDRAGTDEHAPADRDASADRDAPTDRDAHAGQGMSDESWQGLAHDPDPIVRRELARRLVSRPRLGDESIDTLLSIAAADADDVWTRRVVGSIGQQSVGTLAVAWLEHLQDPSSEVSGDGFALAAHLIRRWARSEPVAAAALLADRSDVASAGGARAAPGRSMLLKAWVEGTRDGRAGVDATLGRLDPDRRQRLEAALDGVIGVATKGGAAATARRTAIELAGLAGRCPPSFRELLDDGQPTPIRVAAIPVLMRHDREWTRERLAPEMLGMAQPLRKAVIAAAMRGDEDTLWLLGLIGSGDLPKAAIDPASANRLRNHRNDAVRESAARWLAPDADRQQVLQAYASAGRMDGDAEAGRRLFTEHCSACHRIDGSGTDVGPDISDSRTKTPESLLVAILDPNAAIDAAYVRYSVLTDDGRVLEGLLVDDTPAEIVLHQQGGERVAIPRPEIEEIRSPGISLMPEGFESVMNVDQMRDLISYLKRWRYLGRDIPLSPAP